MVTKIRKTQEEEVLALLKREGFRELLEDEIRMEPYKSIYKMPECFNIDQNRELGLVCENKTGYSGKAY